jgi:hypothetical protein
MSQAAEETVSSVVRDHESQESSTGSSAMGSFVDASKEFADDDFVDLAKHFQNDKAFEVSGRDNAEIVERSENIFRNILYCDEIGKHGGSDGILVNNNHPTIISTSLSGEGKTERDSIEPKSPDKWNSTNHINQEGQFLSEAMQSESNVQNQSSQDNKIEEEVSKINSEIDEEAEHESYVLIHNTCKMEQSSEINMEADRSSQRIETNSDSAQPQPTFQNSLREGKNQFLLMKQTSQTMIQEFTEGKIDITKMISENYEAEYASKKVPSKTFKFIPPAKGLSGNYVDLGRLIAIGVLGLVFGLLASTFTEVTCNFASIEKNIGYSGSTSYMYFGLTKFSSMDSVFTGNKFCVPYHNNYYDMNKPSFARHAGELAILFGLCAMLILWHYIFTKHTTETRWKIGIYASALASLFQICTYQFFLSEVCRDKICLIDVGSVVSAIASASFAMVAFGMIHNSPVRCLITIDQQNLLRNEVTPDFV